MFVDNFFIKPCAVSGVSSSILGSGIDSSSGVLTGPSVVVVSLQM
jgi:hypothetical protein